uniref:Uncharacterized protein n=1 Tax=Anguilla anguilla TaxID=7936 RepID=A0A0E9XN62_ANGAN
MKIHLKRNQIQNNKTIYQIQNNKTILPVKHTVIFPPLS